MKHRQISLCFVSMLGFALLMASQAYANKIGPINDPTNQPPPVGNLIYQLTGQSIISTYQTGTASFVATSATTNLAFAFREDPAFLELANVSLVDVTTSSGNLLTNGDFSAGPVGSQAPTGWSYLNSFGASFGGQVNAGCGPTGNNCYFDGAVQAYDGINQMVATNIGDTYQVSFEYADSCPGSCGNFGGVTVYQPISTNGDVSDIGGNGRDMFVYAGASVPVAAPAPVIGHGFPVLLAAGGILCGAKLWELSKRRRLQFG